MYSILIKNGEQTYKYALNDDGTVFRGTAEAAKERLKVLLDTYAAGKLSVVHNVNLTADFTIEDVE